jgi:hypothetical protein
MRAVGECRVAGSRQSEYVALMCYIFNSSYVKSIRLNLAKDFAFAVLKIRLYNLDRLDIIIVIKSRSKSWYQITGNCKMQKIDSVSL